jgi:hypothetical protein
MDYLGNRVAIGEGLCVRVRKLDYGGLGRGIHGNEL